MRAPHSLTQFVTTTFRSRAGFLSFLMILTTVLLVFAALHPAAHAPSVQAAPFAPHSLFFIPNTGQYAPDVLFEAYGMGGSLTFQADGIVLTMPSTFIVALGANPAQIRWRYDGAQQVTQDPATREPKITMPAGKATDPVVLVERAPVVWQEIDGQRIFIEAGTPLSEEAQVRFSLGTYHPAYPLIIDPSLVFEKHIHFGGDAFVEGWGIATDGGNVYVTGEIYGNGEPAEINGYVMKLNTAGSLAFIMDKR